MRPRKLSPPRPSCERRRDGTCSALQPGFRAGCPGPAARRLPLATAPLAVERGSAQTPGRSTFQGDNDRPELPLCGSGVVVCLTIHWSEPGNAGLVEVAYMELGPRRVMYCCAQACTLAQLRRLASLSGQRSAPRDGSRLSTETAGAPILCPPGRSRSSTARSESRHLPRRQGLDPPHCR